jgi:hypothetical protein
LEDLKERVCLRDTATGGKIILKWILKYYLVTLSTEVDGQRERLGGGFL